MSFFQFSSEFLAYYLIAYFFKVFKLLFLMRSYRKCM